MSRIAYSAEIDRAAASLTLNGFVRGMIREGHVPQRYLNELQALVDDVSRAHGTLAIRVGDHAPEAVAS